MVPLSCSQTGHDDPRADVNRGKTDTVECMLRYVVFYRLKMLPVSLLFMIVKTMNSKKLLLYQRGDILTSCFDKVTICK